MSRTTMETYTGRIIDFDDIKQEAIHLTDISRALALTCRFGGHIPRFYSVAEHAILVHHLVCGLYERPDLALAALHHDSHEAYIGDVPTPLKRAAGEGFVKLASALDDAIKLKFSIEANFHDPVIRQADEFALWIEARELKPSGGSWWPWSWDEPPTRDIWLGKGLQPIEAASLFVRKHIAFREPSYA
jgi:hypothetical protein